MGNGVLARINLVHMNSNIMATSARHVQVLDSLPLTCTSSHSASTGLMRWPWNPRHVANPQRQLKRIVD